MTKLLVILGVIVLIITVIVTKIKKKIDAFSKAFTPNHDINDKEQRKNEDVIYNKDDIVVLKGDAGNNKE